jgi:hypothetical protein
MKRVTSEYHPSKGTFQKGCESTLAILSLCTLYLLTVRLSTRGNGLKNRKVTLKVLKNDADNVISPIKLLLIVALRHGNVQATTIDEVLRLAASRHDKTIKWVHPKRPESCALVAMSAPTSWLTNLLVITSSPTTWPSRTPCRLP